MSSYTRTHSGSPSGSYFPLDPSSHADEPPRHHRGLTRSITNSSFRSFRTCAGGAGQGISEDHYRVLLELQRLLYHGPGGTTFLEGDDASGDDRTESRKDQLRVFVNEHFESDCRESNPASQCEPILIFKISLRITPRHAPVPPDPARCNIPNDRSRKRRLPLPLATGHRFPRQVGPLLVRRESTFPWPSPSRERPGTRGCRRPSRGCEGSLECVVGCWGGYKRCVVGCMEAGKRVY